MTNRICIVIKILAYCVIFVLTGKLFYDLGNPPDWLRFNDFYIHIGWAYNAGIKDLLSPENGLSYPLFHTAVHYISRFTVLTYPVSSAVVCSSSVVLSIFILDHYMRRHLRETSLHRLHIFGLSIGLTVYMSLYIPSVTQIYLGTISSQPWHNPTYLIMKPFAILCFFWFYDLFNTKKEEKIKILSKSVSKQNTNTVILAVFLLLSMSAKPSFFLVFGPALGVFLIIEVIRSRFRIFPFACKILIATVPSIALLPLQYVLRWTSQDSSLIFAPFVVWKLFSSNIPLSFVLSFAFPLFVCILLRKSIIGDKLLFLSVITGVLGILEYVLLAEGGEWIVHGNMAWGSMSASMILFIGCAIAFIKYVYECKTKEDACFLNGIRGYKWKAAFGFALLLVHIATGVFYFFVQLSGGPSSF